MNFPALPTDSLYKFLCIAGLILAVFSIYMDYTSDIGYNERVNAFNLKLVALSAEKAIFDEESEFIAEQMRRKCLDCNCGCEFIRDTGQGLMYSFNKDHKATLALKQELDKLEADRIKKAWEIDLKEVEIKELGRILDHESSEADKTDKYLWRFFWGGVVLFCIGITSWFFRIQLPQDKILAYEMRKKLKELG